MNRNFTFPSPRLPSTIGQVSNGQPRDTTNTPASYAAAASNGGLRGETRSDPKAPQQRPPATPTKTPFTSSEGAFRLGERRSIGALKIHNSSPRTPANQNQPAAQEEKARHHTLLLPIPPLIHDPTRECDDCSITHRPPLLVSHTRSDQQRPPASI